MRARSIILMVIAVLLAGGTAILARSWLAAQKSQPAAAAPMPLPKPEKSVLVARAALTRGQILRPTDFVWRTWPQGGIDKAYIENGTQTPQSFAGWVARGPIAEGEPITLAKIVKPGARGFLAAVLKPGMRAVSIPVNATSGISGFVFPGDRVDVLITHTIPTISAATAGPSHYEHKAAETILRNVRVIGIDQELQNKGDKAIIAHTATLEVTPKQARVVALATEMGKLSLSLRSLSQKAKHPTGLIAAALHGAFSDSPKNTDHPTYTLDSQVSPLLPKVFFGKVKHAKSPVSVVTVLHGTNKAEEVKVSQPATRGS